MHGRGGVPKCVICDACSILRVQFLSQNFSHYAVSDLELFAEYVRAPYDGACLKLNNSKRGRPTPECFAGLVQSYGLYEQLA